MTADTPQPLTAESVEAMGTFSQHRKVATTRISDFTVPPGVPYETPEGLRAEDEPTRVAFDVQGGIYPIRESVFRESYQPDAARAAQPSREALRASLHEAILDLRTGNDEHGVTVNRGNAIRAIDAVLAAIEGPKS